MQAAMVCEGWTGADCIKAHEDVARLIHLHLGTHEFSRHFTVRKTGLALSVS